MIFQRGFDVGMLVEERQSCPLCLGEGTVLFHILQSDDSDHKSFATAKSGTVRICRVY